MKYADLIERALAEVNGSGASLAALLAGVDALDHSVPTLKELNDAFGEVQKRGRFPSYDWRPVTQLAYDEAVAENHERLAQLLESQGISREDQQKAKEWHRTLWSKKPGVK